MNNAVTRRRQWLEMETAFRMTSFMKREFGLAPAGSLAELRDGVLTIRLLRALTPMGQLIAADPRGAEALRCVLAVLYKANRPEMEAIVSRIAGVPARARQMDVDLESMNVIVRFGVETGAGARKFE